MDICDVSYYIDILAYVLGCNYSIIVNNNNQNNQNQKCNSR